MTTSFQRDKSRPAVIHGRSVMRRETSLYRISGASPTALDKSAKPIVSQNFDKSLNDQTLAISDTQLNQHHQSSVRVR